MKSGICSKCGAKDIYGDNTTSHGIDLSWTSIFPSKTLLLACGSCGYLEFYIKKQQDLAKVKKNFQKIES
jgi:predicted nucleic-acid-binding Zn-ribbon protein